jgi:hypothetical protein
MEDVIAEIVSLPGYESQVAASLNEEERMAMEFYIASAPEDHPVIPGAGGFRKARWARRGKGRSGGFREGDSHGRAQGEHWGKQADQTRHGAGAERQRDPGPREG